MLQTSLLLKEVGGWAGKTKRGEWKCRAESMGQCNTSNVKMHSKINSQDLGINHTVQLTSWSGKAEKSGEKPL